MKFGQGNHTKSTHYHTIMHPDKFGNNSTTGQSQRQWNLNQKQYSLLPFHFILFYFLHPSQNFSVMSWVEPVLLKQESMCLAQGHNAMTPLRPEPATHRSNLQYFVPKNVVCLLCLLHDIFKCTSDKTLS